MPPEGRQPRSCARKRAPGNRTRAPLTRVRRSDHYAGSEILVVRSSSLRAVGRWLGRVPGGLLSNGRLPQRLPGALVPTLASLLTLRRHRANSASLLTLRRHREQWLACDDSWAPFLPFPCSAHALLVVLYVKIAETSSNEVSRKIT